MVFNKIIFLAITISWFLLGCNSTPVETAVLSTTSTPDVIIDKSSLVLDANKGLFLWKDQPFTGISTQYIDSILVEKVHYRAGKRHGSLLKWFDSGTPSYEAYYVHGRKDGICKSWWSNGNLRTHSNFKNGIAHGIQYSWYKTGEKFKEINLVEGKEQGLQRAWRKNGAIYNNYEARDGRIFGLKRANLCYEIEQEDIKG